MSVKDLKINNMEKEKNLLSNDGKEIIKEFLSSMKVSFDNVEVDEESISKQIRFKIQTKEGHSLIGPTGENFSALNHLLKKVIGKKLKLSEEVRFVIDVNNFQEGMVNEIENKAKILAERARSFKSDVEMDPMSSYERMIAHSILEGYPEIKTESKGEGRSRRIVIKFIGDKF